AIRGAASSFRVRLASKLADSLLPCRARRTYNPRMTRLIQRGLLEPWQSVATTIAIVIAALCMVAAAPAWGGCTIDPNHFDLTILSDEALTARDEYFLHHCDPVNGLPDLSDPALRGKVVFPSKLSGGEAFPPRLIGQEAKAVSVMAMIVDDKGGIHD